MMRRRLAVFLTTAAVTATAWADNPVSTPPSPAGPVENDLNRARRDADRTANDAARAAGNGGPVDRRVDDAKSPGGGGASTTRPAAAPAEDDIRKRIADVVALAVGVDHMDRLTQRLSQPDRDRIRSGPGYAKGFGPSLDDAARRFTAAWKGKYGHPFSADAAAAALTDSFAAVRQGTAVVGDPKAAVLTGAARNDMAQIAVTASHGLPAVSVPLVREMPDGWKVDVPDTVDADIVRRNLGDEVGAAVAMHDRWPTDEAEAYRAVAHRVLLALMGQPLPPTE